MAEKTVNDFKPMKGMTPKGTAVFPYLNEPDTKFNADGEYKVRLRITQDEAEQLITKFDPFRQEVLEVATAQHKANPKTRAKKLNENELPIVEEFDHESGEPTGYWLVSLKASAVIKKKSGEANARDIPFFDAKGKPLKKKPAVFGGATLKVAFDAVPYYTAGVGTGLTFRIAAVQVVELTGGGGGGNYGFGDEGDGFAAQEDDEPDNSFSNETANDSEPDDF